VTRSSALAAPATVCARAMSQRPGVLVGSQLPRTPSSSDLQQVLLPPGGLYAR
jgi:hypothetical protein